MKIIVNGNLKGGTAKTTSAVNLGYNLSLLDKKVLMIDGDPQTNTTPFFTKANINGRTIWDVLQHPEKVKSCIYKSRYPGIEIIKGNTLLQEKDVLSEDWLTIAKAEIGERYDYCIIDTRPAFENIAASAIASADILLTPVFMDKFCRDNLALVEEFLTNIPEESRPLWKVFATKVDARSRSQRDNYEDLLARHEYPFLETCISSSAVVANAQDHYKPVVKHRSKCQVAQDYMDLAKEVLELEV